MLHALCIATYLSLSIFLNVGGMQQSWQPEDQESISLTTW